MARNGPGFFLFAGVFTICSTLSSLGHRSRYSSIVVFGGANVKSKMAARSDAAAAPDPKDGAFMSFNVVCSSPNIVDLPPIHKDFSPEHIYDRQSLLDIGNTYKHELSPAAAEKLQGLCLLLKPDLKTAASPTDATRTRVALQSGVREDGSAVKRGGIRARLRANPTRPALPILMLSNVRSLENKLDLIQLSRLHSMRQGIVVCLFSLKHG